MGMGYSTLVEHYYGLKKLVDSMPHKLNGVVVFLEAPDGVPDLITWQQSWVDPNHPDLLAMTMGVSALPRFWTESGSSFEEKMSVTGVVISAAYGQRGKWIQRVKNITRPHERAGKFVVRGGIQTNDRMIENARKLARLGVNKKVGEKPLPFSRGNDTLLNSLNELVISAGGQLILFRMPICSVQNEQWFQSAVGRENRKTAEKLILAWNIPVIQTQIQTSDVDFPDLWHLKTSRAQEFTQKLAMEFLDYKQKTGR